MGQVVFTAETAVEWAQAGKKVVLVRLETSPEDIQGMVRLMPYDAAWRSCDALSGCVGRHSHSEGWHDIPCRCGCTWNEPLLRCWVLGAQVFRIWCELWHV